MLFGRKDYYKNTMYLIYVDESGDVGMVRSPTQYFVLSGLVIHEMKWNTLLESIISFRKYLRVRYGLKLREEIHAADFIRNPSDLKRIGKSIRLRILRDVIDFEASLPDVNIINIVVDKLGKPDTFDVFETAWQTLIQEFHNTLIYKNFSGNKNTDYGMLFVDQTDEKRLRDLSRRMIRYNPVSIGSGYGQLAITTLIEDAVHRNSLHSYFIQLSDVNAYFLSQKLSPCGYVKKKGGNNYFNRLAPILCKFLNSNDPQGIIWR